MNFSILHRTGADDLRQLKGGEVGYGAILVDYHCRGFDCRWLTKNGYYEKIQ